MRRSGWAFLFVLAAACGSRVAVHTVVPVPAELPVRVFPEIAIVPGSTPEAREVARALAAHLSASTESRVEQIDPDRLEALRLRGALGRAAAVLRIETRILETSRPIFRTVPETVCGPWGCSTQPRTLVDDVPVVIATLVLRVEEARSERLLQELALDEREEGIDPFAMRIRVVERLRERAITAIEPGERRVEIEFATVGDGAVEAALDAIRGGHPTEGRAALERIVARDSFARRPPDERAKILFNLGQARRLEARGDGIPPSELEVRLALAERTIQDALRLRPEPMFARALDQIADERRARARLRAQQDAASHNFALDREPSVPEPPPGYQTGSP